MFRSYDHHQAENILIARITVVFIQLSEIQASGILIQLTQIFTTFINVFYYKFVMCICSPITL
jgi:hypothetical protein